MTFFGSLFRSRKSDNHSVTASYTPIEQEQNSRRKTKKKNELIPTAIEFKILSDNLLDEENVPTPIVKESREETSTRRSSFQEKQIAPKMKEPVPTSPKQKEPVPLPPTVQIPARQDVSSLPAPESTPTSTKSTPMKVDKKVQFNSEVSMHEPRLSTLVELRKLKSHGKSRHSLKGAKSGKSDESTMESLPPFIEFSNSDVSSIMGKIPTYSERRRKSRQLDTYSVDREQLAGCGGPNALLSEKSKALEGVYNNIMKGELADDVYKRYQDMKIPTPNVMCNDQSTLNACHTGMDHMDNNSIVDSTVDHSRGTSDDTRTTNLDTLKCTGLNASYLNEQIIPMPCANDDDIHRTDSSFSNDSISDSEYEETYPGFYNFVTELLMQGLKNPVQAVTGLADETCHATTSSNL